MKLYWFYRLYRKKTSSIRPMMLIFMRRRHSVCFDQIQAVLTELRTEYLLKIRQCFQKIFLV